MAEKRINKNGMVGFAINLLFERESSAESMANFTIMTITDYLPAFFYAVRQLLGDNAAYQLHRSSSLFWYENCKGSIKVWP